MLSSHLKSSATTRSFSPFCGPRRSGRRLVRGDRGSGQRFRVRFLTAPLRPRSAGPPDCGSVTLAVLNAGWTQPQLWSPWSEGGGGGNMGAPSGGRAGVQVLPGLTAERHTDEGRAGGAGGTGALCTRGHQVAVYHGTRTPPGPAGRSARATQRTRRERHAAPGGADGPELCVGIKKLNTVSNTQINHLKGCAEGRN